MKKYSHFTALALLILLSAPVLIHAQDGQNGAGPGPGIPPPPPNGISARLQTQYQTDMTNLQNNRDYRNTVIQGRYGSSTPPRIASGTPPFMGRPNASSTDGRPMLRPGNMPPPPRMVPPLMKRFASSTAFGSSTLIQQLTADHQHAQDIRADAFAYLQGNLVQQLDQAMSNLQEIQTRIAAKIQSETAQGVDMTSTTADMTTASADITAAQAAIQALAAYVPSSDPTSLDATSTVDLSQARQLGSTAIAAVNAVRQDLGKAVQAIGQAVGVPPAGSPAESTEGTPSPSLSPAVSPSGQ